MPRPRPGEPVRRPVTVYTGDRVRDRVASEWRKGLVGAGDLPTPDADPPAEQEQRVGHRLALEFGSRQEWDDPKLEWRRLFSELLGTFLLVLVAAGGGILVGEGQISLSAAVVAPGLMVRARRATAHGTVIAPLDEPFQDPTHAPASLVTPGA
jgi:hypothetical protein